MTKEELEKEAKKWVRDNFALYLRESSVVVAGHAFKDGAEFGYNKAKEWHYPLKDEYPKDEKDLLMSNQLNLLIKMKGSDALSLALGQYNFSTQEFVYQHMVGLTEVYAWKEIVLPKESEL